MLWDALAENQTPRRYCSGQLIYLQGTCPHCFYYLISGSVRSFISTQSGEERVLTVHRAGDLMGEASFFDECPRVTSAMALEDSLAVSIDRDRLNRIFHEKPELAVPMLRHLARTVHLLSDHVNSAALPARQRIARYLLTLPGGKNGKPLPCTHEEIGQAVGVSRVTVSRTLGEFSRGGLIQSGYGAIVILNYAALENMAR